MQRMKYRKGNTQLRVHALPLGTCCASPWSRSIATSNRSGTYVSVADGARTEGYLPGADYASVEDDQSKTDKPPAPCAPSPAGEQTQVEGERSQLLRSQCTQDSHVVSHRLQASSGTTLLSSYPQPPGLSRAGEVTQSPSQSPQPKRRMVSSATSGERHTEEYHELPLSRTVSLGVVTYTTLWHGLVLLSLSNQSSSCILSLFYCLKILAQQVRGEAI